MKLPSRLIKSRHGVFYYRLQFQDQSKRKEHRISLRTKNPATAKAKSIQISAIIIKNRCERNGMANAFDPNDTNTWAGVLGIQDRLHEFDVELPNGVAFRNINDDSDIGRLVKLVEAMNWQSPEEQ